MSKRIPGLTLKLKKVGNAETFQLAQQEVLLPPGKYILTYDIIEESAGGIDLDLKIEPDQISTNSASYQEVVKYVVGSKKAYLDALMMDSDTPATTQFRLTIKNDVKFTDKKFQNILNIEIPEDYDLFEGDEVLIEAKSDGSTQITVDAIIQAKEVGSS